MSSTTPSPWRASRVGLHLIALSPETEIKEPRWSPEFYLFEVAIP